MEFNITIILVVIVSIVLGFLAYKYLYKNKSSETATSAAAKVKFQMPESVTDLFRSDGDEGNASLVFPSSPEVFLEGDVPVEDVLVVANVSATKDKPMILSRKTRKLVLKFDVKIRTLDSIVPVSTGDKVTMYDQDGVRLAKFERTSDSELTVNDATVIERAFVNLGKKQDKPSEISLRLFNSTIFFSNQRVCAIPPEGLKYLVVEGVRRQKRRVCVQNTVPFFNLTN